MAGRVATNVTLAVQSTIAAATVAATAISQANPGVVTVTHAYSVGDYIIATSTDGMVQLDGQMFRISAVTGTTAFTMEGIDTTNFSAMAASSTTFQKITAFSTLSNATNITMPDGAPAKLDATRLISQVKEYLFGLPDAPDGSISCLYDPSIAAVALIRTAAIANTTLGFRISWSNGKKTIFNAYVSGGQGFDASQNSIVTATIPFTPRGQIIEYAS
jgi:hypothetical protein